MSTADTLLKLLVQATRAYEEALNRELRTELDPELRPAHYAVFRHLDPEGSRVTALAEAAGMTQQSMGELVTHLEQCGYVERKVDPADRRARIVVTTSAGRRALALAADRIAEIDRMLAAELGDDALCALRTALARMPGLIDADAARARA
ncbi:DNA-binding transcriptional regulator, MarR family [Nocardia amikacinitolerans]|uniref:DNA-binding transcriptional regulator, MarR family n=1 Tax=Nocardia amikacinitolerans TaxID=756689 RepID=A0A285LQ04_9NOCA|nr:helix-turn-helix domain-containing protein [Nocardia amikacinitolerans]MCP2278950.1 DNA-binding transcriptional regulator, MarR family [Nocardia amikacinitolerans]MCP2300218.1 DNA-binding transcriptional regulator, MarR family [Nocardia amikacinitolerans]SNY87020.1 DNA-binding transcriptional regulator, MarR family [Nocardia amikacinitolerans]